MADETPPRIWISFDLVSRGQEAATLDPSYVSERLGVEPTQQNRVGDAITDRGGMRTFSRWRLAVGPAETIDIAPLLSELMALLAGASGRIRSLCEEIGIEPKLTCTVEPKSAQTPDITFSPDVIQWAAAEGVSIGVDILLWREDDGTARRR